MDWLQRGLVFIRQIQRRGQPSLVSVGCPFRCLTLRGPTDWQFYSSCNLTMARAYGATTFGMIKVHIFVLLISHPFFLSLFLFVRVMIVTPSVVMAMILQRLVKWKSGPFSTAGRLLQSTGCLLQKLVKSGLSATRCLWPTTFTVSVLVLLGASALNVALPFLFPVMVTVTLLASMITIIGKINTGRVSAAGRLEPWLAYAANMTRKCSQLALVYLNLPPALLACLFAHVLGSPSYTLIQMAREIGQDLLRQLEKLAQFLASAYPRTTGRIQLTLRRISHPLPYLASSIGPVLYKLPGYQESRSRLADRAWAVFNSSTTDNVAIRVSRAAAALGYALRSARSVFCLVLDVGIYGSATKRQRRREWMFYIPLMPLYLPYIELCGELAWRAARICFHFVRDNEVALPDVQKTSEQNASVYDISLARKSDSDAKRMRILDLLPGLRIDPIKCSLSIIDIGDPNLAPFEALSYVWGSFDRDETIEVNGKVFRVSNSLYQALLHLRCEHKPRTLWIDALSINQNDAEERVSQVLLMAQPYSRATKVVVWLGEFEPWGLRHAISATEPTEGRADFKRDDIHHGVANVVAALLSRSWWTRIWVVQELVLAQKVQIQCGRTTLDWGYFCLLVDASIKLPFFPATTTYIDQFRSLRSIRDAYHEERKAFSMAIHETDSRPELDHNTPVKQLSHGVRLYHTKGTDLLSLVYNLRSRHSTEPRDKVFAFLGLSSDAHLHLVDPDYRRPKSFLSIDFARQHIHHYRTLSMVALAECAQQRSPKRPHPKVYRTYVPSWCPDFMSTENVSAGLGWRPFWTGLPGSGLEHGYAAGGGLPIAIPAAEASPKPTKVASYAKPRYDGYDGDGDYDDHHEEFQYGMRVQVVCNLQSTVSEDGRLDDMGELVAETMAQLNQDARPLKWRQMAEKAFRHQQADKEGSSGGNDLTTDQIFHLTLTAGRYSTSPSPGGGPSRGGYTRARNSACAGRRLFVTRDGRLGLGPEELRAGDELHVVLGIQVPVILRPLEFGGWLYRYVGQAYVQGLMVYDGNLQEDIESGLVQLEEKLLI